MNTFDLWKKGNLTVEMNKRRTIITDEQRGRYRRWKREFDKLTPEQQENEAQAWVEAALDIMGEEK